MTLSGNATCVAHGTSTCGTVTGTTGQASFGTTGARINAGAGNPLEFTVPVAFAPGMTADPLVNTATVTDLASGNTTSASHSDTLSDNVTLAVSKEDGSAAYTPGGTLTYTITVADTGLSDALNVTVADPFPAGMTLSANATCVANGTSSLRIRDGHDRPIGLRHDRGESQRGRRQRAGVHDPGRIVALDDYEPVDQHGDRLRHPERDQLQRGPQRCSRRQCRAGGDQERRQRELHAGRNGDLHGDRCERGPLGCLERDGRRFAAGRREAIGQRDLQRHRNFGLRNG